MKVLDLFAGSRSVSKIAEEMGMETFSVDHKPFDKIDLVKDIEFLTIKDIPFIPDIAVAGCPCTTYSIAGLWKHRDLGTPRTEFAAKSDKLVMNTLKLFSQWSELNPNFKWYIENPRGYLRKMPFMLGLPRATVWYCQYNFINNGVKVAKPTDIWSNNIYSVFKPDGWIPRPPCFNNNPNCDHDRSPRGSATGTQGLKGNYERSMYPPELVRSILSA